MYYPESFKQKVKSIYPDWEELHKRLETGDVFVGRYLNDSSPSGISIDTILKATSLKELQAEAKKMKEKVDIYTQWCNLYWGQNNQR